MGSERIKMEVLQTKIQGWGVGGGGKKDIWERENYESPEK